jgi:hypothetical protein
VSPFEYLLPFVSILVGLAVADLSMSLHRLLRARRRMTWDWLTLLAALMVLLLALQFWWRFYVFGRAEVWTTYAAFLVLVAILVTMFLLASAALPDEVRPEGLDLKTYYSENGPYFWSLFALFMLLTVISQLIPPFAAGALRQVEIGTLLVGVGPNLVVTGLFFSLSFVRSRTFHCVLVPLLSALLLWNWFRIQLI